MVEETNRTLFLKRQNDLKGKQLDVLEHLGQLRRPANICQDLAHLGSRQRVLPGSGSDVVFLSVWENLF